MNEKPRLAVAGALSLCAAALAVYSQTRAFTWDEGWHLVAAQAILRGKLPYVDFVHTQTPLNAFWNAAWMRVFGDTWRTANAVAAVMTVLAVGLMADYLLRRFPFPRLRLAAAFAGVCLVGLNVAVFEFAPIGQAYALCLFLIVAAFRFAVRAVEGPGLLFPAAAGFAASAAANASLLTASVGPVLLIWMLVYNRAGSRWAKFFAYTGAALIPCAPFLWFLVHWPRQTLFGVLRYNFVYRLVDWPGAIPHDIGVMLSWIDCADALVLVVLAAAGLYFVRKLSGWDRPHRAEFYLCAWLVSALACHIASGHPNFSRYYLFTVPFLSVLACAGLVLVASRFGFADLPFRPAALLCLFTCLALGKMVFDERDDVSWLDAEEVARKVNEVTPPGAALLADEPTYFVSRHPPYPGCEVADSHKISLPPADARLFHLIPRAELNRLIQAGTFDTIQVESDDERIEKLDLRKLYTKSAEVGESTVFWARAK